VSLFEESLMSVLRNLATLLLATSCCSQVLADPITLLQAETLAIIAGNSGQNRIFWETPDPVGINYLQTDTTTTPPTLPHQIRPPST